MAQSEWSALISRRSLARGCLCSGVAIAADRTIAGRSYRLADFGDVKGGSADHTRVLIAALESRELDIVLPPGILNTEECLRLTAGGQRLRGSGPSTVLRNAKPSGAAASPVLLSPPDISDVVISDLSIQARGATMRPPRSGEADATCFGSAVVICSDRTACSRIEISDAWDNGLAVVSAPYGKGRFGLPRDFVGSSIRTFNCGCGDHGLGGSGRIGSGINILSGYDFILEGCIDRGSNGAQTVDDGGGASGRIVACSGYENPLNGDGTGACFYTGSPDVAFLGCQSYFARGYGFWLAGSSQVAGGFIWGAERGGLRITRDHVMVSSLSMKDICHAGRAPDGRDACITLDSRLEPLTDVRISDTASFSTQARVPRFGVLEQEAAGHAIAATISNCNIRGSDRDYSVGPRTRIGSSVN